MQFGGVKLKNPEKIRFTPVYDMIDNADSKLDVLTYSSLKGFLFTLDVPAEVSEYVDMGKRLNVPVLNYILKFAVIRDDADYPLLDCDGNEKVSESPDTYFQEAKMQQTCWLESISGGRPAICPSVANFSLFDNRESQKLLNFFKRKRRQQGASSDKLRILLDYLDQCCKDDPQNRLGVIVMPRVNNSIPLADFIYDRTTTNDDKIQAYAMVIAQILRLFLQLKVVHFDLHSYNALVSGGNGEPVKTILIDFGSAADIQHKTHWLSDGDRIDLLTFAKQWEDYFLDVDRRDGIIGPTERSHIDDILNKIAEVDLKGNRQEFGLQAPQMGWYKSYKTKGKLVIPILQQAYQMLTDMMKVNIDRSGIQTTTIKDYIKEGHFVNFGKNIQDYYVSSCDRRTGMGCAISGGRRLKSKRTKHRTKRTRRK
jgi:RIO1 family